MRNIKKQGVAFAALVSLALLTGCVASEEEKRELQETMKEIEENHNRSTNALSEIEAREFLPLVDVCVSDLAENNFNVSQMESLGYSKSTKAPLSVDEQFSKPLFESGEEKVNSNPRLPASQKEKLLRRVYYNRWFKRKRGCEILRPLYIFSVDYTGKIVEYMKSKGYSHTSSKNAFLPAAPEKFSMNGKTIEYHIFQYEDTTKLRILLK